MATKLLVARALVTGALVVPTLPACGNPNLGGELDAAPDAIGNPPPPCFDASPILPDAMTQPAVDAGALPDAAVPCDDGIPDAGPGLPDAGP